MQLRKNRQDLTLSLLIQTFIHLFMFFSLGYRFFKELLRIKNKTDNGLLSSWLDQLNGQSVVSSYRKGQRSIPCQALIFSGSFLTAQGFSFYCEDHVHFDIFIRSSVVHSTVARFKKVLIQVKKIRIACQRVGLHGRGGVNHHSLFYGNGRSNKNSGYLVTCMVYPRQGILLYHLQLKIHNPLFLFVWRLVLVADAVVVLISLDWQRQKLETLRKLGSHIQHFLAVIPFVFPSKISSQFFEFKSCRS